MKQRRASRTSSTKRSTRRRSTSTSRRKNRATRNDRASAQQPVRSTNMSNVLSAAALAGDAVVNSAGEKLGKIEDFMLDADTGRIRYAVLSFGGVLGIGNKL